MTQITDDLRRRLVAALRDPELAAQARGLSARVVLAVSGGAGVAIRFGEDGPRIGEPAEGESDVTIQAGVEDWAAILAARPPRGYQSFTALQLVNPKVEIIGDPLRVAQARPALERLIDCLRDPVEPPPAPAVARDIGQIRGRYAPMEAGGECYDIYLEEAGSGVPVVFLHTAGADSRQYGALLADTELASRFRLIAYDLPFHGRSLPPLGWDGGAYRLDQATYLAWVAAFLEQIVGEPAILVGCSMGAAITLVAAAERPELLRGAVALEPPLRSPGRRNPYLAHAAVSGGAHNGAYVHGLMSPTSPEGLRRRAAWIYAQGGPGVYTGDLGFYSDEFDGHVVGPAIDTGRVPVSLLTGEYDYSATVEDGRALAGLIPGSRFVPMPGLGHFPMCEHPDLFRTFFEPVLAGLAGQSPR
jgi:pimeloyl-ACP methyl ester carboxylesterase